MVGGRGTGADTGFGKRGGGGKKYFDGITVGTPQASRGKVRRERLGVPQENLETEVL